VSSLEKQVQEKAGLAVNQLQERAGGCLNYSEESLDAIEAILDEAGQYADQMEQSNVDALVQLIGSYILAVAHKAHGGAFYWHEQQDQPVLVVGEPQRHVAIMTFSKVKSRLGGDKADNIPFFYQGFSTRVRSATPGTHALYV
jgi:hypothetical protein